MIARLRLAKLKSTDQIYGKIKEKGTGILPDIGLAELTASDYYVNVVMNDVIDLIRVSTVLSYMNSDGYLAITRKG